MPRVLTRRRFALAGLSAATIPLLAACSAPAPSSPTAAPTAVPQAQAKPTEAPKPAAAATAPAAAAPTTAPAVVAPPQAGTRIINVAMDADPVSFDCHVQTNFSSAQGSEHFYESLTAFDDKLSVVPGLAASWEQGTDGLSWTFKLDPNAKFHDGSDFTADDVKWTTDRLLSPEIKSSWAQNWYSSVKGAVVVDKKTIRIELKNPWPIGPGVYASLRGATMY